jgi:uncharacterized Ntn-hydrolase superfamily protein
MRTVRSKLFPVVVLVCVVACAGSPPATEEPEVVATFSIVAFDPDTGDLGVAVQSKFFGVGSVVPYARAGVGAVATQAFANTTWGPEGLALLEAGESPQAVLDALTLADAGRERRQAGIVDAQGRAAAFTGKQAMAFAGHVVGKGFSCQGNILAGEEVVEEMARTFRASKEPLPERLVAALLAGQVAGGDKRGRQSAALLVVRKQGGYAGFNDRYVDLRVEDHPTPIEELARLLLLHRQFFPNVPVPGPDREYQPEPLPEAETLATPRGTWEAWKKRLAAKDWKGLYALYTRAYREQNPLEAFTTNYVQSAEGFLSFLSSTTYLGTSIDGDQATIALTMKGSPRRIQIELVRENGVWLLAD